MEYTTDTATIAAAGKIIDLSTKANITLSVLSFVLALLSIVFVFITIKQNNKLLYSNARPYLAGYFAYEENNKELYFCVKNSGNSSAIIRSMVLTPDLEIMQLSIGEALTDTMLSPHQQIHFLVPHKDKIMKTGPFQYEIKIEYEDVNRIGKRIIENYTIDLNYLLQVFTAEHNRSNLNSAENALVNIERDLKFLGLNQL